MQSKNIITIDEIQQLLDYNPDTGIFAWRVTRNNRTAKENKIAGSTYSGYVRIQINGRHYRAHRIAWLLTYGHWPNNQIDHIDGDRSNNRISNLREATNSQNSQNRKLSIANTSGYKGVYWHAQTSKWQARIMINGRGKHLGLFDSAKEAHAAYCIAADRLYGEFANYGASSR